MIKNVKQKFEKNKCKGLKKINNMGIINKCRKMKKDKKKGTTVITIGDCPSVVSKGSHTDKAEGHVVLLGTAGQEGGGETYCTSVSSSGGYRRFRAVVVLCVCVCVCCLPKWPSIV